MYCRYSTALLWKFVLWATVASVPPLAVAVPVVQRKNQHPPPVRLEYDIGIKVLAEGDMLALLQALDSATIGLLEQKGIVSLGLAESTGGKECFPWYIFWKNRGCTRASYLLEAYPVNQTEADRLVNLTAELVDLIASFNHSTNSWYKLIWIIEPHAPRDLVEFDYRVSVQTNPKNLTTDDAVVIVQGFLFQRFAEAGIDFWMEEMAGGPCSDDDTMCENIFNTCYTTREGCQPIVSEILQHSIASINEWFEWFNATTPLNVDDGRRIKIDKPDDAVLLVQ